MHDEEGVLLQNIVGAEYIVCTHWLNIVGATAPNTPMVSTPMPIRYFLNPTLTLTP